MQMKALIIASYCENVMANRFSRRLLRGKLQWQNLQNESFDDLDIRGIDFSNANLTNSSFKNSKAGIPLFWFLSLAFCLFILTILTSLVLSYTSVLVVVPYDDSLIKVVLESCLTFGVALFLLAVMMRYGIGGAFSLGVVLIALTVSLVAAVAQYTPGSVTEYVVAQIALRAIGLTCMLGGVATTGTVVASSLAVGNSRLLIVMIIIALPAIIAGLDEGIGSNVNLIDWPLAGSLSLITFTFSTYIGFQAIKGNPKFKMIQTLATWFATLKTTRFKNANLMDVDFTQATLKNADFRSANLTRTRWFQAKQIDQACTWNTYLENLFIRQLVVTGQGQNRNFDYQNLRGLNLQGANLADASFIGADLSNANLQDANLSRAKLVKTQLYNTRLNRACLTGANIQDWAISLDTQFNDVQCDYVYMHLPTPEDQDPYRKPDNRDEFFAPGDFADFITPIIKTLDLYQRQNFDPRVAAKTYRTVDLFHHDGIDPAAAAVALQRLVEQHPEAGLEVIALEGRGDDRIRLQARVSNQADPSELSKEYFEQYREIKDLAYGDLQALLREIEEKDSRIRSLENMVTTAIKQKTFYVETYQNMGDTVTEKRSIEFNAGRDISGISGIVGGDVSGVMNLGTISGNVTNSINQLPDNDSEKGKLKNLLQQLQSAIEEEPNLEPEDKAEALEQVQTLAEVGQKPEDSGMQKAAKTAIKILKGTTAGLSETANLVTACNTLLPAISSLLLLL